tara:strand:+ start:2537 stop:3250 length:714 start_codon:yes stop_codon:yes gene_type:complete
MFKKNPFDREKKVKKSKKYKNDAQNDDFVGDSSIPDLNLKNVKKKSDNIPIPNQYQKLRILDWPPPEVIDSAFFCIFCGLQSSPRSITPIIAKNLAINKETGEPFTPRTQRRYVEYSCNDCVNSLKSTTSSPRLNDLDFTPPSPSFSPRNSSELKRNRIHNRRSLRSRTSTGTPIMNSGTEKSLETSPTGSLRGSPRRYSTDGVIELKGSPLRRSQTVDSNTMNVFLAQRIEKNLKK